MEAAPADSSTLSLHDALPIFLFLNNDTVLEPDALRLLDAALDATPDAGIAGPRVVDLADRDRTITAGERRSEEHTSELQSQFQRVCRPLLEKKNRPSPRPRAD